MRLTVEFEGRVTEGDGNSWTVKDSSGDPMQTALSNFIRVSEQPPHYTGVRVRVTLAIEDVEDE